MSDELDDEALDAAVIAEDAAYRNNARTIRECIAAAIKAYLSHPNIERNKEPEQ